MLLKAWVIVGGGEQNRPAFKDNSCLVVLWCGLSDSMGVAGLFMVMGGQELFFIKCPNTHGSLSGTQRGDPRNNSALEYVC